MTSYLVTGGTGSFGNAYIRHTLTNPDTERVVVFSRDELKQHDMRQAGLTDPRLRWFIGDVRDPDRLRRAMQGIQIVIHAAALKQVDTCEYNPIEAKRTNIDGAANLVDAALDAKVWKVIALGTDKAVDPTNLYGATKLVQEKLVVDANAYSGARGPVFACTRYGNVISSRGSVVPVFERLHAAGQPLRLTAEGMTRFVMTLPECVRFVDRAIAQAAGGEVFVPKLPAVTLETIAHAVAWPDQPELEYVGLRPGEKMHEAMVSTHEAPRTHDRGWCYAIAPLTSPNRQPGTPVAAGFSYTSDTAARLTTTEFRRLAGLTQLEAA